MQREKRTLNYLEISLVFLGFLVASVYGNNDFSHRIAVSSFFVICSLLVMFYRKCRERSHERERGIGLLLVFLMGSYFCGRALLSPVEEYGEKDFMLFAAGLAGASVASDKVNYSILIRWLPWLAIFSILLQCSPLIWQLGEPSFVPFRDEMNKVRISGFFGHQNFFAIYMGIAGLVILSYLLMGQVKGVGKILFFLGGVVLSTTTISLTASRGALIALLIALAVLLIIFLLSALAARQKWRQDLLIFSISFLALIVSCPYLLAWFANQRGLEEGFFSLNARGDLLLMVADCRPESWLLGGGARFFQDEVLRTWDTERLNNALGDPRVVHNEYAEAFVNYGYVGVVLLLMTLILALSYWMAGLRLMMTSLEKKGGERAENALQVALGVSLIAMMIQFTVDFTLHVLPLMIFFGVILGCLLKSSNRCYSPIIKLVALALLVPVSLWVKAPYLSTITEFEKAKLLQTIKPTEAAKAFANVGRVTGMHSPLATAGHVQLLSFQDSKKSKKSIEKALTYYLESCELHPSYGNGFLMTGKLAIDLGSFDEAEKYLFKSLELVGNSERLFGTRFFMGSLLFRKLQNELKTQDMTSSEVLNRLGDALAWIHESRYYHYRLKDDQKAEYFAILGNYYLHKFFEASMQGEESAKLAKFSDSFAQLTFAKQMYYQAKRRLVFSEKHQLKLESVVSKVNEQISFLKRKEIKLNKKLLKKLKLSIKCAEEKRALRKYSDE